MPRFVPFNQANSKEPRRSLSVESKSASKESFVDQHRKDVSDKQGDGFYLQLALSLVVVSEAAFIGAEIEAGGPQGDLHKHNLWYWLTNIFIFLWIVLISVRVSSAGWAALRRPWNILDASLTAVAMIDAYLVKFSVGDDAMVGGFLVKRSFRVLKLLRLFRLLQIIRLSEKLRRLSDGLMASLRIIGLVLILLAVVLYMSGVYMTIIVGHTCDTEYPEYENCDEFFGHVWGSMFTLYQVMTLDDWSMEVVRPTLTKKKWLVAFYVPFMMVTTFGLLNVIVGAVVETTLNAANEEIVKQKKLEDAKLQEDVTHIRDFFYQADQDGNGLVDVDEFQTVMKNKTFRTVMKKLALPTEDPHWLFNVFDVEEKGSVSIEEIKKGLLKFREHPSPTDMHTALMTISGLSSKMHQMETLMLSLLEHHGIAPPQTRGTKTGSVVDGPSKMGGACSVSGNSLEEQESSLDTPAQIVGTKQPFSPADHRPDTPESNITGTSRIPQLPQASCEAQMRSLEQSIQKCFEEVRQLQDSYKVEREGAAVDLKQAREALEKTARNDQCESASSTTTRTGGKSGTPTPSLRHLRSRSLSRGLSKEVVVL